MIDRRETSLADIDRWLKTFKANALSQIADFEDKTGCVVDEIILTHDSALNTRQTVDLAVVLKI